MVSDAYIGIIQGLSEFFILIFLYLTNVFLITTMNGAQPSGISGKVMGGKGHALVPQDDRWLELSVCYHTPTGHFCTPPFLSSYQKHLTHSSESTTYSIPPCNNGKNSVVPSSKSLTCLKCSVSLPNPAPLPKQKISSPSAWTHCHYDGTFGFRSRRS